MRGSIDVAIYNGNHAVAIARQSQHKKEPITTTPVSSNKIEKIFSMTCNMVMKKYLYCDRTCTL